MFSLEAAMRPFTLWLSLFQECLNCIANRQIAFLLTCNILDIGSEKGAFKLFDCIVFLVNLQWI